MDEAGVAGGGGGTESGGQGARSSRAVSSSQVIVGVDVVKLSAATRLTVTGP